jgi:hypothetical protein
MVMYRTLLIVTLACGAFGCASLEAPIEETESWKASWKQRAENFADGASRGAGAVGETLTVAAKGVAKGFDDPDAEAWGAYPKEYPRIIQTHLRRFEGLPKNASLRFGRPVKGYMNQGLFQGGGIAWQGYLVDVMVAVPSRFEGQEKELSYTIRMRDGEVIEVHDARYASALRREEAEHEPGPGAMADAVH